jgi:Anti-sigma-K factor rskA
VTGEQRDGCPQEELAVGWAMHSLEPDEEAALRAHLPGCARCRQTVLSTQQVTAVLGGSLHQYDPPARLKSNLMSAIEHTPQEHVRSTTVADPIPLAPRRARWGRRLLVAAAVVAVLGAGGVVAVRMDQLNDQVVAQEQRADRMARIAALAVDPSTNRAELAPGGAGEPEAVLLSGTKDAAVMPMKLAPNNADQSYVVWGTSTFTPVALARFDVRRGEADPTLLTWSEGAHQHNAFAISLEPGHDLPTGPPTEVVVQGQVGTS